MKTAVAFSGMILLLILLASNASAYSICASESFDRSCRNCAFTGGRIDQKCKDSQQTKGQLCVSAAYPISSGKYFLGMCPALDRCIETLKACTAARCPGNDFQDCSSGYCKTCYAEADACAYMADKDCNDEEKCGNGNCVKDKGEDQTTCCRDCGCPDGKECRENTCVEKKDDAGEGGGDEPEEIVYTVGGDFLTDLLLGLFGCIPFLLAPVSFAAALLGKALRL